MKQIEWPDDILNPPGVVGDVVRWIRETSPMFQPKFALAAGLTACGALVGRAVKDWTGQRTNLYTLAIGNTAAGKNAPLGAVRRLVSAVGGSDKGQFKLIMGEATSASAIEAHLSVFPVRLLLIDEIGHYISTVRKAAGDVNLGTVIPAITKCWSCAGDAFIGRSRAKDSNGKFRDSETIKEPCVCIYGATTPDVLFDSLATADFADGSITRFLSFISFDRPKYKPVAECQVPVELVGKVNDVLASFGVKPHGAKTQSGASDFTPVPCLVKSSEAAEKVLADLNDYAYERMLQADKGEKFFLLWGRAVEMARRVSLIVASFRDCHNPVIDEADADYAAWLIKLSLTEMCDYAKKTIADTSFEKDKKRILAIIREAGTKGVEKSVVSVRAQSIRKQIRDEVLEDLEETGEVVRVERPGRTKHITVFYEAEALKLAQRREQVQFKCDEADL